MLPDRSVTHVPGPYRLSNMRSHHAQAARTSRVDFLPALKKILRTRCFSLGTTSARSSHGAGLDAGRRALLIFSGWRFE